MSNPLLAPTWPLTPEQGAQIVTQRNVIAGATRALLEAAARALPDRAPFEMTGTDALLWHACEEAERVLRLYDLDDGAPARRRARFRDEAEAALCETKEDA